jgi:hypothetical protein
MSPRENTVIEGMGLRIMETKQRKANAVVPLWVPYTQLYYQG